MDINEEMTKMAKASEQLVRVQGVNGEYLGEHWVVKSVEWTPLTCGAWNVTATLEAELVRDLKPNVDKV